MHSLPTNVPATKSFVLKHKLPTQLQCKRANTNITRIANATIVNTNTTNVGVANAHVDDDLLATVLRVHLETKLRRERARCLRQRQHVSLKARVLQRATTALADEPSVAMELSSHHPQFGFRAAFHQLSHLQQH